MTFSVPYGLYQAGIAPGMGDFHKGPSYCDSCYRNISGCSFSSSKPLSTSYGEIYNSELCQRKTANLKDDIIYRALPDLSDMLHPMGSSPHLMRSSTPPPNLPSSDYGLLSRRYPYNKTMTELLEDLNSGSSSNEWRGRSSSLPPEPRVVSTSLAPDSAAKHQHSDHMPFNRFSGGPTYYHQVRRTVEDLVEPAYLRRFSRPKSTYELVPEMVARSRSSDLGPYIMSSMPLTSSYRSLYQPPNIMEAYRTHRASRFLTDHKPYHTVRELELDRISKDKFLQKFFAKRHARSGETEEGPPAIRHPLYRPDSWRNTIGISLTVPSAWNRKKVPIPSEVVDSGPAKAAQMHGLMQKAPVEPLVPNGLDEDEYEDEYEEIGAHVVPEGPKATEHVAHEEDVPDENDDDEPAEAIEAADVEVAPEEAIVADEQEPEDSDACPAEVPAELSAELPAEVPAEVPTEVPSEVPAEVPEETVPAQGTAVPEEVDAEPDCGVDSNQDNTEDFAHQVVEPEPLEAEVDDHQESITVQQPVGGPFYSDDNNNDDVFLPTGSTTDEGAALEPPPQPEEGHPEEFPVTAIVDIVVEEVPDQPCHDHEETNDDVGTAVENGTEEASPPEDDPSTTTDHTGQKLIEERELGENECIRTEYEIEEVTV